MSLPGTDRFDSFAILKDISYGSIRSQSLPLDIMLPKTIGSAEGPRPILFNFHGGGMIGGQRDFQTWWAVYILEWAAEQNAILIAPDYPLTPESQSTDMLESLRLLMSWVQTSLQQTLDAAAAQLPAPGIVADTARLAAVGDSAGGWMLMHLGLMFPEQVRAVVLRFPMLDLDDAEHFSRPMGSILGTPTAPRTVHDDHVARMTPGRIVTGDVGGERFQLISSTYGNGLVVGALGDSDDTFPLRRLESKTAAAARLPRRLWIFHGTQDSVVPVRGSEKTARLIEQNVEGVDVKLDQRDGEHGFDLEWTLHGDEPVMRERLAWLAEEWLR